MRITSFEVTMAILAAIYAAAAITVRRDARRDRQARATLPRVLAEHDRAEQDRRDSLDALIEATREKPHQSHAWGPGSEQPVPYLPAEVADLREWEQELAEGSGL